MRLIDADRLIKAFQALMNTGKETFDINLIYEAIDEQPIVYDVDKIIEQLKNEKFNQQETILSDIHQGYNAGLSRAIQIWNNTDE